MTAVDTSVIVAALSSWHPAHQRARPATRGAVLVSHSLLESYSVLTRLPGEHRLPPDSVAEALDRWFNGKVLTASAALQRRTVKQLHAAGIEGGAVYDGLIGLVVKDHDEHLLTLDERAARTYRALGVSYELL